MSVLCLGLGLGTSSSLGESSIDRLLEKQYTFRSCIHITLVRICGLHWKVSLSKQMVEIEKAAVILWRFSVWLGKSILGTSKTSLWAAVFGTRKSILSGCFPILVNALKKWILWSSSALNTCQKLCNNANYKLCLTYIGNQFIKIELINYKRDGQSIIK